MIRRQPWRDLVKPPAWLALATGLTLLFFGCLRSADKSVTIAADAWVGNEPLFLARSEGWLGAVRNISAIMVKGKLLPRDDTLAALIRADFPPTDAPSN